VPAIARPQAVPPTPAGQASPAVAASPAPATNLTDDERRRLDAAMNALVAGGPPGIALGIVREGKLVYARGYGVSDRKTGERVTGSTQMEIGSVTKQFTAAAVMQLVEAGKLTLDDPLGKYVTEYAPARDVTIRQLLWQVSGVPNYTSTSGFEALSEHEEPSFQRIVALIAGNALDFPSGTRWAYSNTNYILLGRVIEKVTGDDYDAYVKTHILDPTGMTRTTTIAHEKALSDIATGYKPGNDGLVPAPAFGSGWAGAAGDLVSDVGDIAKWDAALLGGKIVDPADVRLMMTPGKLSDGKPTDYGMGWVIGELDGHRWIWHNGGTIGFGAVNALFPDDGLRIIALVNSSDVTPQTIAARAFEALRPDALRARDAAAPGEDPSITARVKGIVANLQTGTFDRTQLTQNMSDLLTPALLKAAKGQLGPLGTPVAYIYKGTVAGTKPATYQYLVRFRDGTGLRVLVAFDADGRIATLGLHSEYG
jgi:CubicO group peptidase (beta-lactamase class C family)